MVKLIRLASDNNGIFKSNFQNDINIEPNSQIALLNCTFKSDFPIANINQDNNLITVQTNTDNLFTLMQKRLETGEFGNIEASSNKLLTNIKRTLNNCLSGATGEPEIRTNNLGSQFNIRDNDEKKQIEYRYAPFLNPLYLTGSEHELGASLFNYDDRIDIQTSADPDFETSIRKAVNIPAVYDRRDNIITGLGKFTSGNGLMTIRINNNVDNLSGGQNSGFGIGLTTKKLTELMQPGEEIVAENRGWEIRLNTPTENYYFLRNSESSEENSGVAPNLVNGGDLIHHDFIFFERVNGRLEAGVMQQIVGPPPGLRYSTRSVFFDEVLGEDENELYPYIYIRGTRIHMVLDMFNMCLDPWVNQGFDNDANQDGPRYWSVTGYNYFNNIYSGYWNSLRAVMNGTDLNETEQGVLLLPDDDYRWKQNNTYTIKMHKDVWHFLGFNRIVPDSLGYATLTNSIGLHDKRKYWAVLLANDTGFLKSLSDSFMIDSQSLQLDSYDASKVSYSLQDNNAYENNESDKQGRRKNILMTIPINDNTSGLVEFNTNTPIFIDINNAHRLNQKTLNFQILDKNFKQIFTTSDTSIMTILIKDKNE
jgi:hypothetical protein